MVDNEDRPNDGESLALEFERALDQGEQINLTTKLQTMLLLTYEKRLLRGTISDTGLAALQRLLAANGWSLDPQQLPSDLKDKLTSKVDPAELDADVLPFRKQA